MLVQALLQPLTTPSPGRGLPPHHPCLSPLNSAPSGPASEAEDSPPHPSECSALHSAFSHELVRLWDPKVFSATLGVSSCCFLRELKRDKGTPGLGTFLTGEQVWERGCRHWFGGWTESWKALFGFSTSQIIREGDVSVPSGPQLGHKMSELSAHPVSSSLATPDFT